MVVVDDYICCVGSLLEGHSGSDVKKGHIGCWLQSVWIVSMVLHCDRASDGEK